MAPSINVNGHANGNGTHHLHAQATNGLHAASDGIASLDSGVKIQVNSPDVSYSGQSIVSAYRYEGAAVQQEAGVINVTPTVEKVTFKTDTKVGKVGLMMVGWGGNNGTTVTASILANSQNISWHTKEGIQQPNYYGSMVMASTLKLGLDAQGNEIYVPFRDMVPMVHPNDLVIGGWDISGFTMDKAMERAQVLEYDLQRQVAPQMAKMKPLPSIYYPDFIAANQNERADNLIAGKDKWAHVEHLRKDIRDFKAKHQLDKVIVMWTANTERYADIISGVNDTAENLLKSIKANHEEVSPSTIFAVASILEDAPYVNGAPQNTFVPGCIELAEQHKAYIGGDDFKSGQTKFKSVIADFLISAGIKVRSIASYNHLGNNDGRNLSSERQFKSKEISKRGVVDDMVDSNSLLYSKKRKEHPDHCIVIKYLPAVGDSKRALDEYYNEIFMGGRNTVITHNTCEDSLLASPLILDLVILAELHTRIELKKEGQAEFSRLHSVMSLLSYMLKAPMVKPGHVPINSLTKQRNALNNILRALIGLRPENDMLLETRI